MEVSNSHAQRHSEESFSEQLLMLIDSGAGVIHVRTNEILRAAVCIRKTLLTDQASYNEWDVVNGTREFLLANHNDESVTGDNDTDLSSAFAKPLGVIRDAATSEHVRAYTFLNPQAFMDNNPYVSQLLLMYNEYLPTCRACVILVTPDLPLPDAHVAASILSLHFEVPGLVELRESLDAILKESSDDFSNATSMTEDDLDRICHSGAGMSRLQFETHVSLATIKAGREDLDQLDPEDMANEVQQGKTEIVNSSDTLELYPASDIDDVGGMDNLKSWVAKRKGCYSEEAAEFGVEPPKGLVLVGPPGTGKSLVAKAISGVFGVPLVRMDFGRVFSSYVGSSEQRVRSALRMVESMAPIVLFVDEIDKGLGGIASGGGSDSGVSMRVLGSFLTWLNDCKAPVFTMVTANNITGLPPELLRRGRFDAIFSTAMPTDVERREVFDIHLRKRGVNINKLDAREVDDLIEASNNYVPAELESAVRDGLVEAFSSGTELTAAHIRDAVLDMVPMSRAFAAQIEQMTRWASDNATPVTSKPDDAKRRAAVSSNKRRVSTRRRTSE